MFYRNEIGDQARPPYRRYPWQEMEEYLPNGGMWRTPTAGESAQQIEAAANLMRKPGEFLAAMLRVGTEWPRSIGVAMSTPGLNRRAWMGHAGCFLAVGSVEECTRLGWHALDPAEQVAANEAADEAIDQWHAAQSLSQQGWLFDA